jgi:PAS domain S-box-containing protein
MHEEIVLKTDYDGKILFANKVALRVFNYESDKILLLNFIENLTQNTSDKKDEFRSLSSSLLAASDKQLRYESEHITSENQIIWILWEIKKDITEDGKPFLFFKGKDLTDDVLNDFTFDETDFVEQINEKALQTTISSFISEINNGIDFIDYIPCPVSLKNKNFQYVKCNSLFLKLFNKSKENVIGKTLNQLSFEVDFSDDAFYDTAVYNSLETCKYIKTVKKSADNKIKHYAVIKSPVINDETGFEGIITLITDISDFNISDTATAKMDFIFDNSPQSIVILNKKGKVVYWNKASESMFGYLESEVTGKSPNVKYKEKSIINSKLIRIILKNKSWEGQVEFHKKNGSKGISESVAIALDIETILVVNRDITKTKA